MVVPPPPPPPAECGDIYIYLFLFFFIFFCLSNSCFVGKRTFLGDDFFSFFLLSAENYCAPAPRQNLLVPPMKYDCLY